MTPEQAAARHEEPTGVDTLPTEDYRLALDHLREPLGAPSTWTQQTSTAVFDALAVMYRAGHRAAGMPLSEVAKAVGEAYRDGHNAAMALRREPTSGLHIVYARYVGVGEASEREPSS